MGTVKSIHSTMDILTTTTWIIFILTAAAFPEIPSKGKQSRIQDSQSSSTEDMPRFAEPIPNVTVSIGRDALLACVVENLKGYKVAWVRVDTQTILSIHHNVITQNSRISLTYNDHRSWYLHIREVEEEDRGWYMCQINTDPMRSRKGYLQVVVPPIIIESLTSNDMVVREGTNVTLTCKARGFPEPYVMWRREDGEEMTIGRENVNVVDGEYLHITKVSRLHMAAYLCVASNGVPPSISKRVHLRVQFPPMLSIPNQLEGAFQGQDVTLECHTEAYPASINYWTTERGDMIISDTSRAGDKFETTSSINGYSKYMRLKIRNVSPNDYGSYRCVAKNSLGETDGIIKLDEILAPTTLIAHDSPLNRSIDGKRPHRNKYKPNYSLPDYGIEEWKDDVGDNSQTPIRNPPGAFHNSALSLGRQNILHKIILQIKLGSFQMFSHLKNYSLFPQVSFTMPSRLMPSVVSSSKFDNNNTYFFVNFTNDIRHSGSDFYFSKEYSMLLSKFHLSDNIWNNTRENFRALQTLNEGDLSFCIKITSVIVVYFSICSYLMQENRFLKRIFSMKSPHLHFTNQNKR